MARDVAMYFTGTTGGFSTTAVDSSIASGPAVDLGSNSVNRAIMVEMRILSQLTTAGLDVWFQDSTDNSTYASMGASATTSQLIGFNRAITTSYGSTDAVAANAPARILVRTDKRYIRAQYRLNTSVGPSGNALGVSIIGVPVEGAYTGAVGPRDT